MVLSLERWVQSCHFIYKTPERPYIALFIVFALVNLLGAHVVRSAYMGIGKLRVLIHDSGQAEISYLDIAMGVQEDVAWLQVAMQDFMGIRGGRSGLGFGRGLTAVALVEAEGYLHQYLPNNIFCYMILLFASAPDNHSQIPTFAIFHDDIYPLIVFVYYPIVVLHYVWMCKLSEYVDF